MKIKETEEERIKKIIATHTHKKIFIHTYTYIHFIGVTTKTKT